ncbi:hypothetical protein ES692_08125 [Psychroserpens burtonensis]|uniref:Plug domain-containing protein n=1 Tax=Psychroserpens burtonensis TaxID=49278 RepID=A0A5C7B9B0_9FLAO|nr:hypothetical protein [Psychroserpens burtonensis]TXE17856.1 hypothetical protein ES692_08125 [Psychroserpens burtonensis]
MKNVLPHKPNYVILVLFSLIFFIANSQQPNDEYLFDAYKNYSELPREIAYGHLNKSTLIKGESLGFSIYLLDKYTKTSSLLTKNVYCTIQNRSGKIIKKKMILAKNGVASGIFKIDSLFKSGNYVFKAYTNWMRNFEEQNFYVQHLKVINPDKHSFIDADDDKYFDLDAQFLPEGGHLLLNAKNTVGVVIKDDYGFGVPYLKGRVLNTNGEEVANFETNSHGISKFKFTPKSRTVYTVELSDEEATTITLDIGEPQGVNMSLQDLNDKVALVFRTNESTLPNIANESFKLAIGNGSQLNVSDIAFKDKTEIKALINLIDFNTGINIITLFNKNNKPVLERLYFKHDGIKSIVIGVPSVEKLKDSLLITIPSASINTKQFNNLSISVLPAETKSYNHHHNIFSSTLLQPYVKGCIENARYYFTNIDNNKKSELDNLLLTQGWSSNDWTTIFNTAPTNQFEFENGITINASLNNTKGNKFLFSPLQNSPSITLTIKNGERNFSAGGLLPLENEPLKIGVIDKKDRVLKPNLYVQFSPMEIPSLEHKYTSLKYKNKNAFKYDASLPILDESWNKIEALDTVLLSVKKEEKRIEKIKRFNKGRVDVFNDSRRKNTTSFASYIGTKGFSVFQDFRDPRSLLIDLPRKTSFEMNSQPLIYLNDLVVNDQRILMDIDMSTMDYVIIDKSGLGEGIRGANGVIKIYTNYMLRTREYNVSWDSGQEIEFPLTFSESKKFYTPLYSTYLNDFYQNYGVIDWFPKCEINDKSIIRFKVLDTKIKQIKLFIEGTANDGAFISEEKIITIN